MPAASERQQVCALVWVERVTGVVARLPLKVR